MLHPRDSRSADYENKHTCSYLPPASSRPLDRYAKCTGLRQGSVLNILFCFVPFWPVRTEANFGLGDRRAHLQSMELTLSRQTGLIPPVEKTSTLGAVWVFFLLSRRDWQD